MNGCGNFSFGLVSNVRGHLAHAVHILRGEPTPGARIESPRPLIGWSMDGEWMVLWEWLDHGDGKRRADLFPAPIKSDAAIVAYLENWLDNSPMVLERPDIDGSVERDAFEIVSERWKWQRYGDSGPQRTTIYAEAGEVLSIRRVWSEYHK